MEDSKLIFSMDHQSDSATVVFSKESSLTLENQSERFLDFDLSRPHASSIPHSPSSPGSLAALATTDVTVGGGLVKSSSQDLKPRESGSVRGKPLLSLVKSLSTEISRRVEPEDDLSKSDSKLHVHPRRQQQKRQGNGDSASPPPSGRLSPTEHRGASLIADLEDTRRRFSEAMQDPLSMISKMMKDEGSAVPKQESSTDYQLSQGSTGREEGSDDLRQRRKADRNHEEECGSPEKHHSKGYPQDLTQDLDLEIPPGKDSVELFDGTRGSRRRSYSKPRRSSLHIYWLSLVGLLAYGLFVLPLSPYTKGLSMGVALGFILGLAVVYVFGPGHSTTRRHSQRRKTPHRLWSKEDPDILEGWMTVTHTYDPETFHPSSAHSVYVTLEGGRLRLAYPVASEESPHESVFSSSCSYQLANCKVSLVPAGLACKRLWNKKYPICLTLAEGEKASHEEEDEDVMERHTVPDAPSPASIYLFGRTGREKEEWFQYFSSASRTNSTLPSEENNDVFFCETAGQEGSEDQQGNIKTRTLLDYSNYMSQLMSSESNDHTFSPGRSDDGSPSSHLKIQRKDQDTGGQTESNTSSEDVVRSADASWINALVGRIFWDFLRDKYWTDQVAHKIQKKLGKIKLPYFMNELTLADLDMGTCLPQVLSTSKPTLDRRGLWLEVELMYTGCLQMTLETKMNLCKLGSKVEDDTPGSPEKQQVGSKPRLSVLADSDEESSSACSSDEEEALSLESQGSGGEKSPGVTPEIHASGSTSRKILRFVDKIAKSKYFQKATENEYIRKKIVEVSNMPLMLSVEVLELSGTLAINIPPPPTDRIWYSFQTPPRLDLHVRPMLGEREVTFTHVTEWIETKLKCEFQKVFVMPNMDDIYLPLMTSGLEHPTSGSCQTSVHSTSHQSSVESQEYLPE
ncbi:testis-expressed protein 2-like [Neosynchiropus ocellatus]